MAWEKRGNNKYYYRKKRIGKRVVSEYIGNDIYAELLAEQDYIDRKNRRIEKSAEQRERKKNIELSNELDRTHKHTNMLVRAILLLAGFYPHKGQMRHKREK